MDRKHKLVLANSSEESQLKLQKLMSTSELSPSKKLSHLALNENNIQEKSTFISLKRKYDSPALIKIKSPSKKLSELVHSKNNCTSLKSDSKNLKDDNCVFISLKPKNNKSPDILHRQSAKLEEFVTSIKDGSSSSQVFLKENVCINEHKNFRKSESSDLTLETYTKSTQPSLAKPSISISSDKSSISPVKKLSRLIEKTQVVNKKPEISYLGLIKSAIVNDEKINSTDDHKVKEEEKEDKTHKQNSVKDCKLESLNDNKFDLKNLVINSKCNTWSDDLLKMDQKVELCHSVVKKETPLNMSAILKESFQTRGKFINMGSDERSVSTANNLNSISWTVTTSKSQQSNLSCLLSSNGDIEKKTITSSKLVSSITRKPDTIDTLWENPVIGLGDRTGIPSLLLKENKTLKKLDKIYSSCTFTKDMLKTALVIGPVDNKFIACLIRSEKFSSGMLLLVDQHAAHERIRLEKLLNQVGYYTKEKKKISGNNTALSPPATLSLNENNLSLLLHYKKEFSDIGLRFFTIKKSTNNVFVSSVPAIFVSGSELQLEAKGSVLNKDFLKEFILEQICFMKSTGCPCNTSSRTIFKALASYACHGAIRFGDKISLTTCKNIMKDLALCDLPFQCAHGRPTIAPIFQIDYLDELLKKKIISPQLYRIKSGCKLAP